MANPTPASLPDIAEPIARAFGRRPIRVPVPAWFLLLAGALSEVMARMTGQVSPITRNKVREALQREWVCDSTRAAAELGWRAQVPLQRGIRDTAQWYRQEGWL
jgi:nucleoside-diphosphate-sugar epimerase